MDGGCFGRRRAIDAVFPIGALPITQRTLVVHNLLAVDRDLQVSAAAVGKIGLDLDITVDTGLDRIWVGPEHEIMEIGCGIAGIPTGSNIAGEDRKSTRLNSSHLGISYAVFCLKKKKK